jgi:hypothetical protein
MPYFIKFNTIQILWNFFEFIHRSKWSTMQTPSYDNMILTQNQKDLAKGVRIGTSFRLTHGVQVVICFCNKCMYLYNYSLSYYIVYMQLLLNLTYLYIYIEFHVSNSQYFLISCLFLGYSFQLLIPDRRGQISSYTKLFTAVNLYTVEQVDTRAEMGKFSW